MAAAALMSSGGLAARSGAGTLPAGRGRRGPRSGGGAGPAGGKQKLFFESDSGAGWLGPSGRGGGRGRGKVWARLEEHAGQEAPEAAAPSPPSPSPPPPVAPGDPPAPARTRPRGQSGSAGATRRGEAGRRARRAGCGASCPPSRRRRPVARRPRPRCHGGRKPRAGTACGRMRATAWPTRALAQTPAAGCRGEAQGRGAGVPAPDGRGNVLSHFSGEPRGGEVPAYPAQSLDPAPTAVNA